MLSPAVSPAVAPIAFNKLADVLRLFQGRTAASPGWIQSLREGRGGAMIALGIGLATKKQPATSVCLQIGAASFRAGAYCVEAAG
ncbi:hypothetical protein BQ8482_490030 [Mesorhizobium delmotii]|uniref:Uncharacterized protein n=1 Tax=Mesorhizobium delmotii TaxID=1631247 RepID=A0A2P9AUA3_9HYPH|nr:hypothetical protein BQ8482_490030 [Mesorhizobium delmotii]